MVGVFSNFTRIHRTQHFSSIKTVEHFKHLQFNRKLTISASHFRTRARLYSNVKIFVSMVKLFLFMHSMRIDASKKPMLFIGWHVYFLGNGGAQISKFMYRNDKWKHHYQVSKFIGYLWALEPSECIFLTALGLMVSIFLCTVSVGMKYLSYARASNLIEPIEKSPS